MSKSRSDNDYRLLKEIFNKIDPICVADMIDDEYDLEISDILSHLPKCKDKNDIKLLVFDVLEKWFDQQTAIYYDAYLKIANEIISHVNKFGLKVETTLKEPEIALLSHSFQDGKDVIREIFYTYIPNQDNGSISEKDINKIWESLPNMKFENELKLLIFQIISERFNKYKAIKNDAYLKVTHEILKQKSHFEFRILI